MAKDGMEFELTSAGLKLIEVSLIGGGVGWGGTEIPLLEAEETPGPVMVSPEQLRDMTDVQLLELHEKLHDKYIAGNETVLNIEIFLHQEAERRGLDLPEFDDELDEDREEFQKRVEGDLGGEVIASLMESLPIPRLVPFVVTHQGLSLTGSSVYGLKPPHDLDWLIRHSERLPYLEQELLSTFPEFTNHFVYELKGPNWSFCPLGEFMFYPYDHRPEALKEAENTEVVLTRLRSFIIEPRYIFLVSTGPVLTLRVNSDVLDTGTQLKLERQFGGLDSRIVFSTLPKIGERPLGSLLFVRYKEPKVEEIHEPEFRKFYSRKLVEDTVENETPVQYSTGRVPEELREVEAPVFEKAPTEITLGKWYPPIKAGAFSYAGKEVFNIDDGWKYWGQPMLEKHGKLFCQIKYDC